MRYLEHAADAGRRSSPTHFEVGFGGDGRRAARRRARGGELRVRGRIDRVDVGPGGEAVIVDYKVRQGRDAARAVARRGPLQAGLYLLAVRHVLGLEPVGALYQPLGAERADARAARVLRGRARRPSTAHANDRIDAEELDALLDEIVAVALEAVAAIRAGALERARTPAPATRCAYPGFCRWEP